MKYYYITKDFLSTRNGKILLLAATITIAAIFSSNHLTSKKSEAAIQPIPSSDPWADDNGEHTTPLQQTKRNKSFEPFTPIAPKPEKLVVKPKPKPQPKRLPVIPPRKNTVRQIAPLFKEQRKASKPKIAETTQSPTLPTLETGAVIHCRLLTPATTDHANLPVIAQITRPVIRNGIVIIPKGSRISGSISTTKNKRIFFAPEWQVHLGRNTSINLSAQAQEKSYNRQTHSYNLADGRIGLPGFIENEKKPEQNNILGEVVKGIARLGKETVKTAAGEYVPSTGKNTAINIGSTAIDGLLPQPKQPAIKQGAYIHVPAGREFYLIVNSTAPSHGNSQSSPTSIDQLWIEAMRKRMSQQAK